MAQIVKTSGGGKIIWDSSDWLAGLHPRYNSGPTDTPLPKSQNKLSYSLGFHPYRAYGMAAPGFLPTSATNASAVTDSSIRSLVMGAESTTYYAYGVNSNTLLHQVTQAGAVSNSAPWPHTVTPSAGTASCSDAIYYSALKNGTRAPRIFYSYNSSTANVWSVGRYDLDGTNFDDDFMSENGASGGPATPLSPATGSNVNPHPMIVGDDDVLYIGDGNLLHAYDGANIATNTSGNQYGKFFNAVLTLPANFRITSFAKYQKNLVIFGYVELATAQSANPAGFATTQAKAYFWDYLSLDPYDSKLLNDNYVSCAFDYNGTVGCFTYGRKLVALNPQLAKVMLFNGSEFEPVATFDTNPPYHGAVEVLGDTVSWVSDGSVYLYGSPYPGADKGLNRVTKGNGTGLGAIRTLSTTVTVISTGTTTSGGLDTINSGYGTGFVTTAPAMPVFEDAQIGKVKKVKVFFGQTSSADRELDIYMLSDFGAQTQILAQTAAITASNQVQTITKTLTGSPGSLPRFTTLACILQWQSGTGTAAPIVDRIEAEFENVSFNNA